MHIYFFCCSLVSQLHHFCVVDWTNHLNEKINRPSKKKTCFRGKKMQTHPVLINGCAVILHIMYEPCTHGIYRLQRHLLGCLEKIIFWRFHGNYWTKSEMIFFSSSFSVFVRNKYWKQSKIRVTQCNQNEKKTAEKLNGSKILSKMPKRKLLFV